MVPSNHRSPWSAEEDRVVSSSSAPLNQIADSLGRSYVAVKTRRRQLSGKVPLYQGKNKYLPRFKSGHLLAKSCIKCLQLLPASAFGLQSNKTSYQSKCKECKRFELRHRRATDPIKTAEDAHERTKTQQVALRRSASNHGKQWTGPELELVAREDLSASRVAKMLGRSLYAVKSARSKVHKDPSFIHLAGMPNTA